MLRLLVLTKILEDGVCRPPFFSVGYFCVVMFGML